jgi:heat shock protein HtpX
MKRVLLFVLTNVAVMVVLSAVVYLFGLDKYLSGRGGMGGLLVVAAIFGFGGAFISLAMSKWIAKRSMGVQVIEQPGNATEKWLLETVRAYAKEAHIGMPEVGIFDSPEPNAFATGMRKDAALVAVSTGLLNRMRKEEVEAVIGHEVAHVANGDMVTLTLIQGVVNTFVFFIARVIGNIVDNATRGNSERSGPGMAYFVTVIFAEMVLGILASMIVMYFSRQREFRADHGGAWLAGRQNMIGALEALQRQREPQGLPANMAAFGINGGVPTGLRKLFMSHPPLEERIAVLKSAA